MLSLKDFKKLEIIKNSKNISGGRFAPACDTKTGDSSTTSNAEHDRDDSSGDSDQPPQ